jgi:Ser/Thr protein kinase RdoA (MazF antagonist)
VRHEHSILRYLAQVNFPAPRLVMNRAGDSLVQRGQDLYALFDYLDGYFQYGNRLYLPSQTRQILISAGQALGGLHQATRDFNPQGHNPNGFLSPEGERARELAWFLNKLDWVRQQAGFVANRVRWPDVVAAVDEEGARLAEQLPALDERLKAAGLTRVVIHGDYGPYNLLFKHGRRVQLVDFELARLDWPLTDLAKSMTTFTRNRFGFSQRKARIFVDAYRETFDLAEDELSYLPDVWRFLTLRRVVVCWHRYFKQGDARWAKEAGDKLALARWISTDPLGRS